MEAGRIISSKDLGGGREATKGCPELLSLVEAAKLLGVPPHWLKDRAEDYGVIRVRGKLRFFREIVGSTVVQIVDLLKVRLIEEWREYEQTQNREWEAKLAAANQLRRDEEQRKVARVSELLSYNRKCGATTKKGTPCPHSAFRDTDFCWLHRKAGPELPRPSKHRGPCGALTKSGTLCQLDTVTETTGSGGYTNLKRCQHHQGVHPDLTFTPLPPKKRSRWTPEMREAARERAWEVYRNGSKRGQAERQKHEGNHAHEK